MDGTTTSKLGSQPPPLGNTTAKKKRIVRHMAQKGQCYLSVERPTVQVLSTEKRTSVLHSTDVKLGRVTTTVTTTTTRTTSTSNIKRPHIRS